jgi:hypothetical protein
MIWEGKKNVDVSPLTPTIWEICRMRRGKEKYSLKGLKRKQNGKVGYREQQ